MPERQDSARSLTSGRLLARNTVWHLFGQIIPLVMALISIPILVGRLGTEKFGVLTLVWLLIGYFSFFDFGLGRTLTKLVADRLAEGRGEELPALIWTGVGLLLVPGLLGAAALTFLAPYIVESMLHISDEILQETLLAFYLCALAIPILVGTEALIGVLMARQRHDLVNTVKIPMGVLMFMGPVLLLPFSRSLTVLISTLVVVRVVALVCYLFFCFNVYEGLWRRRQFRKENLEPLLRVGGWISVSSITGPLLSKIDRFMIGALISVTAVAYYATPYEVVTKLWVVPTAIVTVLFPAFAVSYAQDRARMEKLFHSGTKYVLMALFPVTLMIVAFAPEGLNLWLGQDFASHGTRVMQLLAVGVFMNSLAQVPFVLIQGAGRPDLTAKLHMIELPIYIPALWWSVTRFGIEGAAMVWLIRAWSDMVFLYLASHRLYFRGRASLGLRSMLVAGAAGASFVAVALPINLAGRLILVLAILGVFLLAGWRFLLSENERRFIQRRLQPARSFE